MNRSYGWLLAGCCAMAVVVSGCTQKKQPAARVTVSPEWTLDETITNPTPAQLRVNTLMHLANARAQRDRIVAEPGPRTMENTLAPYNELWMHVDAARNDCSLFANVHPDDKVREQAEWGERQVQAFLTELVLDRRVYDALASLDVSNEDDGTQYYVFKELREFRRRGVDKDDDTRAKLAQLQKDIVELGQQFDRNIRDDGRSIKVASISDLDGLPDHWIAAHPPGEDGTITVTTEYPDLLPFMTFAKNGEAREQLYRQNVTRGYPANIDVLQQLLTKRHELATLMGYASFADYETETKMIESALNAQTFIDRIAGLAERAVQRDYEMLLERKRQDHPGATVVADFDKQFYSNLIKKERFAVDAAQVSEYFNYPAVEAGILELTGQLFGVECRQVYGLDLWSDAVTAWDLYDGRRLLGRFYLDMHPRANKYSHAACFTLREGVAGKRLPQAVLVCNFSDPRKSPDGKALMEHQDVVTYLHEFGHLVHALFAGGQTWVGNSGISTELDFVEAPSQMLEEWAWTHDTLKIFARDHQTGEPIDAELVERMREARLFGKAMWAAHQMFYASVALGLHRQNPTGMDSTALVTEMQNKYSPFKYVNDTHMQCSFGHLNGYSSNYYTYMWSMVIAKDLLSAFEEGGLMNRTVASRYRRAILEAGGSAKAADLVADFLGRPYGFEAFESWLNEG